MNSLFESHEKQYGDTTSEITFLVGQLVNQLRDRDEESQKTINKIERLMADAKDLLQQMELEMASVDVTLRGKYKTRWQSHCKELSNLEKEYKNVKMQRSNGYGERNELFGSSGMNEADSNQRDQLIKTTERLERTGDNLEEGYRVAVDTEGLGNSILQDLSEQREKLTRGRDRLRETNEDLATSSRLLSTMTRKIMQNRVVLAILAIVMFLIIGLGVYMAVRRSQTPK